MTSERVTEVRGRTFRPALAPDVLSLIQRGTLLTTYRGREFLKNPFDVVLYQELIGRLRPATIIEIGTKEGGSAIWFADQQAAQGILPRVVTVDVADPPTLDDPRVTFLRGDALALDVVLAAEVLAALVRPWLVVEDSAHLFETCLAVLDFFDPRLQRGEYVVVEDGIVADLPQALYRQLRDGPNRAVKHFLETRGPAYEIDTSLCDRYGHNVTWAPNAWLRRC